MKNYLLLFCLLSLGYVSGNAQYCSAAGNTSTYEWIERVSFGFDKKVTGNNGGYNDAVTYAPMHASQGMCFYMNMEPGYSGYEYNEYWGVWIDFNKDGDFSDSGENVYLSTSPTNYGAATQISIPSSAPTGFTTMRVIMKYGSAPSPCGSFSYGEVEDYSFYIEDGLYTCDNGVGSSAYEWIDGVGIGDLYLFNGINDGSHVDYCQLYHADLSDSLTISMTPGYSSTRYEEHVTFSFDMNNDNDFSDPGETMHLWGIDGPVTNIRPFNYDVEPDVCHRVRVQLSYYSVSTCEYIYYGEVEEYAVYVTDINGISAYARPASITTRQGHNIGDPRQGKKSKIAVFPNPASNYASIDFGIENEMKDADVSILDISGRVVLNKSKEKYVSQMQIDLDRFSNGTYIVKVAYTDKIETTSLVVVEN